MPLATLCALRRRMRLRVLRRRRAAQPTSSDPVVGPDPAPDTAPALKQVQEWAQFGVAAVRVVSDREECAGCADVLGQEYALCEAPPLPRHAEGGCPYDVGQDDGCRYVPVRSH